MNDLQALFAASASRHNHLCPRQVLGVRVGLLGADTLGLKIPRKDKRLLVIVETDGCFADGVEAAAQVSIGHRTLRVEDYGKIAAAFIDTKTENAVRVVPKRDIREMAWHYAPEHEKRPYYVQLHAYQEMPSEALFELQPIRLVNSVKQILSRAGFRTRCDHCGEEIINERQIQRDGLTLCRACTGQAYYTTAAKPQTIYSPILSTTETNR